MKPKTFGKKLRKSDMGFFGKGCMGSNNITSPYKQIIVVNSVTKFTDKPHSVCAHTLCSNHRHVQIQWPVAVLRWGQGGTQPPPQILPRPPNSAPALAGAREILPSSCSMRCPKAKGLSASPDPQNTQLFTTLKLYTKKTKTNPTTNRSPN